MSSVAAGFHRFAAEHHHGAVGDLRNHAHVVGDEQDGRSFLLLQHLDEVEDLPLDRHVERRRRLVGDQELRTAGKRHGDHDALAHAAGEAVRVFVETRSGRRDADLFEQANGLGLRFGLAHRPMAEQRFGNLVADGEQRVQAGHRLLEDHRDFVAAHAAHVAFRQIEDVAAAEHDSPFGSAHVLLQQAHDRQGRHALARAGFTDDRHRLARHDRERDVPHHRLPGAVDQKRGCQVLDRKHRLVDGSAGSVGAGHVSHSLSFCTGWADRSQSGQRNRPAKRRALRSSKRRGDDLVGGCAPLSAPRKGGLPRWFPGRGAGCRGRDRSNCARPRGRAR